MLPFRIFPLIARPSSCPFAARPPSVRRPSAVRSPFAELRKITPDSMQLVSCWTHQHTYLIRTGVDGRCRAAIAVGHRRSIYRLPRGSRKRSLSIYTLRLPYSVKDCSLLLDCLFSTKPTHYSLTLQVTVGKYAYQTHFARMGPKYVFCPIPTKTLATIMNNAPVSSKTHAFELS